MFTRFETLSGLQLCFIEQFGAECRLFDHTPKEQEPTLWLGKACTCSEARADDYAWIVLSKAQAEELLPMLQLFVKTGKVEIPGKE